MRSFDTFFSHLECYGFLIGGYFLLLGARGFLEGNSKWGGRLEDSKVWSTT